MEITAKIDHGIPIVTMKSSAGFTNYSDGKTLTDAFRKALEKCIKESS